MSQVSDLDRKERYSEHGFLSLLYHTPLSDTHFESCTSLALVQISEIWIREEHTRKLSLTLLRQEGHRAIHIKH